MLTVVESCIELMRIKCFSSFSSRIQLFQKNYRSLFIYTLLSIYLSLCLKFTYDNKLRWSSSSQAKYNRFLLISDHLNCTLFLELNYLLLNDPHLGFVSNLTDSSVQNGGPSSNTILYHRCLAYVLSDILYLKDLGQYPKNPTSPV